MELPVNMANHMADFATQLFGHLSDQMNVAGIGEVSCNARTIADTAQQCGFLTLLSSVNSACSFLPVSTSVECCWMHML